MSPRLHRTQIQISGMASGDLQGLVLTAPMLILLDNSTMIHAQHVAMKALPVYGDSGAPVYAIPNADGNTEIAGILVGGSRYGGEQTVIFSPWHSVEAHLELDSIP